MGEGVVNNIKSVESSVTKVACPSVFMCFSACPFHVKGFLVCVHVIISCFWGSSQRGWRLRFGGDVLVSALIEQHVGCFRLQGRTRVGLHKKKTKKKQGYLTPRTESQEGWQTLANALKKQGRSPYTVSVINYRMHRSVDIKESNRTTIWSSEAEDTLLSSK